MDIFITDASSVPAMQKNGKITKVLTLIEPEFPMLYYNYHNSQITRLNMVDVGTDENLTSDHYLAPSKRHIDDIINFAINLKESDRVLIHCYAGKSRSTAAAMIVMYKLTNDFETVKKNLVIMRPIATPNRMLCRLADEYFNTGTKFVDFAKELWDKDGEIRSA